MNHRCTCHLQLEKKLSPHVLNISTPISWGSMLNFNEMCPDSSQRTLGTNHHFNISLKAVRIAAGHRGMPQLVAMNHHVSWGKTLQWELFDQSINWPPGQIPSVRSAGVYKSCDWNPTWLVPFQADHETGIFIRASLLGWQVLLSKIFHSSVLPVASRFIANDNCPRNKIHNVELDVSIFYHL